MSADLVVLLLLLYVAFLLLLLAGCRHGAREDRAHGRFDEPGRQDLGLWRPRRQGPTAGRRR